MQANQIQTDFCIEIDFSRESRNPSRVFRAMSDLIDACQEVDTYLIHTIDSKIEPVLLLENIEASSIKTWLRQLIEAVDDESLNRGDFKATLGRYLVKSKYQIINFLDKKTQITDAQLIELEDGLQKLAEETNVRPLPFYRPISRPKLLQGIQRISTALEPLSENDRVKLITPYGEATFNLTFSIAPETIQELITSEVISTTSEMILKVKRPEFLSDAMWEFKHQTVMPAKILDHDWLVQFQAGAIELRPGSALRVLVKTTVRYGIDREVVATEYEVLKVVEVIPPSGNQQKFLPLNSPS